MSTWTMHYNGQVWTISDDLYAQITSSILYLNKTAADLGHNPGVITIPFNDASGSHDLYYAYGTPIHFSQTA